MLSSHVPAHKRPVTRQYGSNKRQRIALPDHPAPPPFSFPSTPTRTAYSSSSPPTSPPPATPPAASTIPPSFFKARESDKENARPVTVSIRDHRPGGGKDNRTGARTGTGQATLDSFFAPVPTRAKTTAKTRGTGLFGSQPRSASSISRSSSSASSSSVAAAEQLILDLGQSSALTIHCPTCGMSYARGAPEDEELHRKHHKRVVRGIEWPKAGVRGQVDVGGVEWVAAGRQEKTVEQRILVVPCAAGDASSSSSSSSSSSFLPPKTREVLSTIDTELGAVPLSARALAGCKIFLCLRGRTVVGAAVVGRIGVARRVRLVEPTGPGDAVKLGAGTRKSEEEEDGAVFVDPTPHPTTIGIHRIWVSSTLRRSGIASLLLNAALDRFIYGSPKGALDKARDVAFSQPTRSGRKLAERWTGRADFLVFDE